MLALAYLARTLMPGGTLDEGHERTDRAMAPLGLQVTERPRVRIEPRVAQPGDAFEAGGGGCAVRAPPRARRIGAVRVRRRAAGERGRGRDEGPRVELKAQDGRLRASDGTPESVVAVLEQLPASTRWWSVRAEGGPDGIVVQRKGNVQGEWLCDLGLAERLAEAL